MAYISPATNRSFLPKPAVGGNYNKKPKAPTISLGGSGVGNIPQFNAAPGVAATNAIVPSFGSAQKATGPQLGAGGDVGGATTGDPRDPTYWTDIAKIKQTYGNTMAGYDLQQTRGQTALTDALASYDKAEPIDISNARGSFNNSGLFYSTRLGQAQGDIVSKYKDARTKANTGFNDLVSGLNIERGNTTANYGEGGIAYADAFNNATGRQTERDTTSANNNALAQLAAAITGSGHEAPASSPAYGPAAAAAGVSPATWIKTTYTNSNGHPVRVYGDGRKEVQVNGKWHPA